MSLHSRRDADWWGAGLLESRPSDAPWAIARSTVSYGQLRAQVSSLRHTLRSYGIGAGNTVALQGARSFTQMWALLALWSCGAQVMLMGPGLRGRELGTLLDRCRPQYHLSFDAPGWAAGTFHDECEVLVRRLKGGRPAETPHCLVQFTSGSTGIAKAIGRTPESLTTELGRFRAIGGMPRDGERALLLAPPEHSFGLIGGLLHAMNAGAVTVFARDTGPRAVLEACRAHDVDAVLGAPAHFAGLAALPGSVEPPVAPGPPGPPAASPASPAFPAHGGAAPLPRLRTAVSAGDVLVRQVATRFAERFGVRIGQAYGTTETGIIAVDTAGVHGPGTVGVPAPGVRVRLVSGELQVRLPGSPYLAPEDPPARFLADGGRDPGGWLCTRDLVEVDPAGGALRLLGRLDPPADRRGLTAGATQRQVTDRTIVRQLGRDGSLAI
ncbi:class I adenylate-forming enzyme family protein [Streptomyces chattanoogensis]|uniref:class I adenylate-forming enzyme family protein n=1 Tax=Streptomyces chattanoogensis TaxID=66876 RepID=UPI0006B66FFD|nr:class I adenylate-forming enzyme family protein [Streptomyces chattanoogensis]